MVVAILYGISMFTSGWHFGKKDHKDLDLRDVGFRFHLTTYLTFVLISELWFLLGFNSSYEQIGSVHITAFIWGICLLVHGFVYLKTRKNTIDGLDKSELFE